MGVRRRLPGAGPVGHGLPEIARDTGAGRPGLASETFIGVLTTLSSFDGDEAALGAWVFTIAHRRLVDDWRRRSRRPALAECGEEVLTASAGGDVEAEALTALGSATVQWVCSALPVDQGTVLLLRLLADLTVEQWAR